MKILHLNILTAMVFALFSCFGTKDHADKVSEPVSKEDAGTNNALPAAHETSKVKSDDKSHDDISLQQARILSRMSEIEGELKRQREKIRLLEQGLLTGIAPDDLRKSKSEKAFKGQSHVGLSMDHSEESALGSPNLEDVAVVDSSAKNNQSVDVSVVSEQKQKSLEEKLRLVRDLYQASRFGVAISELASISREFGENTSDGQVRLWLGKCYARLKEFTTARVEIEAYLKGWPSGSSVAEARLELAKVYSSLGLKERARGELRRVMKDFAGQEPSEIASAEFNKMQGGL